MHISHSVTEGQRHNNLLTRVAFVYNGPKGMELAPNPHYSADIAKALGGSFKLVMLARQCQKVRELIQLPKETQKNGDIQTNQKAQITGCQFSHTHVNSAHENQFLTPVIPGRSTSRIHFFSYVTSFTFTFLSLSVSLSFLTVIFPGEPGLASFIEAKDDGSGGDNWSYKWCKASVKSLPPKPTRKFLQARCPSCRPTNSVKALKGNYILSLPFKIKKNTMRNYNFYHCCLAE